MLKIKLDNSNEVDKPHYPCLKISSMGKIVLFTAPNTGMCLVSDCIGYVPIGDYSKNWVESMFEPYTGSITLFESKE